MKVLEQYKKQHGKAPEALLNKPDLPWYYEEIFNYYMVLSNRRRHLVINTYKMVKNQVIPQSKVEPEAIDPTWALSLAKHTAIMKPKDFLSLVCELDTMYLQKHRGEK